MKKLFVILFACVLCGSLIFTGCSNTSQDNSDGAAGAEVTEDESAKTEAVDAEADKTEAGEAETGNTEAAQADVLQEDIEEGIIGSWIVADRQDRPALTNQKVVFTFTSPTKAYISASLGSDEDLDKPWNNLLETDVDIDGNKVTITWPLNDHVTMVDEIQLVSITSNGRKGDLTVKSVEDGKEKVLREETVRLVKVENDYSKDILGTWEGRCTSEGSAFDDGKVHRWEYKEDGTYVYYIKDGDDWVPGDDTLNEYFVAGNLLCSRWIEDGKENREWWEISIDDGKMNWTALREDEAGKTFTVEFEMTKVEE